MKSLALFVVSFVVGPVLFWILARQRPTRPYFASLFIAAMLLAAGGLLLPHLTGKAQGTELGVLVMLWLGWIMVLTLCALAVRARTPGGTASRTVITACAMATTLPWFGLVTASMIGR